MLPGPLQVPNLLHQRQQAADPSLRHQQQQEADPSLNHQQHQQQAQGLQAPAVPHSSPAQDMGAEQIADYHEQDVQGADDGFY